MIVVILALLFVASSGFASSSDQAPQIPPPAVAPPAAPPAVERLGPSLFRVGGISVNAATHEVSIGGTINDVVTLEFVANTKGGMKAYESALTLDTTAVAFNTALILIGLDKSHARVPTRHFDPAIPEGDPVAIGIDVAAANGKPALHLAPEELLFDKRLNRSLEKGDWVYTGSMVFPDGRYLAEMDGVLIGFVHSPAPVIENPRGIGVSRYGDIVLNPNLGLTPGLPVTLTVKAIGR